MSRLLLCFFFLIFNVEVIKSARPGSLFRKPRWGLHMRIGLRNGTTINDPTKENLQKELVVLLNGYNIGVTVISLATANSALTKPFLHINPLHSNFYTNAYRWALRHLSLIPRWIGGNYGGYPEAHKVWRRRYFFMDSFVPKWMRKLLPFVKEAEWTQEEQEYRQYQRLAEPTFGKHYTYPNKNFDNWTSQFSAGTDENIS